MIAQIIIKMIRLYQIFISPLFPPCCRFCPSCSDYCIESIKIYGVLKGLKLGILRILRCNPWSAGGFDPVPKKGR